MKNRGRGTRNEGRPSNAPTGRPAGLASLRVRRHVARSSFLVPLLAVFACTPSERPRGELRFWTDKYALRVSSTPSPPRARSRTLYRVEVRDKDSGRPMEKVEGQIYASNAEGRNIYDALTAGPELGTYYATLNFINAAEWALNLRFRGTPTDTIEIVSPDGWRQVVAPAAQ